MQVLIYVNIEGTLHDYKFYTRELSPVVFSDYDIGIGFLEHKVTHSTCLCLFTVVRCLIPADIAVKEKHKFIIEDDGNSFNSSTLWTVFKLSYVQIIPDFKATVDIDAHVASCVVCEINRSRIFRRRFLKYVRKNFGFKPQFVEEIADFDSRIDLNYMVEIRPQYCKQKIDFAWGYRIEGQVVKRMILEEAMAWLSTLGGGYSSLGDYFSFHAEEAGKISFRQLRIAVEMGDPIVAAKCRLFFAQSLMQRGYFKQSKLILRNQVLLARSLPVKDDKLIAMIRALRARFKYLTQIKNCSQTKTLMTSNRNNDELLVTMHSNESY